MFFGGGIPFAHAFPGGMPGGMGGGRERNSKPADTTSLYKALGVEKTASADEIRKAYTTLVRTAHPDRGGDPDTFKGIQKAYEVLKDPKKRAIYDEHGEEGLEGGGGDGPRDIFEAMGMRQSASSGPRKADDLVHPLAVSLEDLYLGKTVRIAVQAASYERDPSGTVMDRAGNRYAKNLERVVLEVVIDKGMMNGQKITFEGKGNTTPGSVRGDVVIVIQQKEHPVFQRSGCDLVLKKKISLYEALTGPSFVVEHLDGHKVLVTAKPGECCGPDAIKQVADEGMPVAGHTQIKGVLLVQFEVVFPERLALGEQQVRLLSAILPGPASVPKLGPGMVQGVLEEADMEARKARERLAKDAYDEDEGGGPRGGVQQVQCAQQ